SPRTAMERKFSDHGLELGAGGGLGKKLDEAIGVVPITLRPAGRGLGRLWPGVLLRAGRGTSTLFRAARYIKRCRPPRFAPRFVPAYCLLRFGAYVLCYHRQRPLGRRWPRDGLRFRLNGPEERHANGPHRHRFFRPSWGGHMPSLKGTETEQNLKEAFAGE